MKKTKEINYTYALSIDNCKGYIILSDENAETKAKELWKKTKELKKEDIEKLMESVEEIFLGLQKIKGGFQIGILVYLGKPLLPKMNDICRAFANFAFQNQEEDMY